ncbi:haloacid dehalogenase type II [Halomonas denitrificans]|uniref:haloacid dehalogenase type II n=1 Tax=Halomonas denitrificans TaxID=370769 RepID=UPI001CD244B5|nr:haloacid dehalogenase type II [Halomonas denitrificans]MCA0975262.1 haloacid dehalogenase type II [Halomonas denitrificans]
MSDHAIPKVLVFDVNETLLDLTHLEPLFERLFGDPGMLREWFAQLILYSQTMTLSGLYTPFGQLGAGALRMTADIHDISLEQSDIDELASRIGSMPAHPDVAPALERLKAAGFRLVTLTNSAPGASPSPLERAGLSDYFERSFSVEPVRQFKPAASTYAQVAQEMQAEGHELCLIACHLWDTIGAQACGWQGALVLRPYNALLPAQNVPMPDYVTDNLSQLADQLIT